MNKYTLSEICADVKNYFYKEIHEGSFWIYESKIEPLDFLKEGQYFRIVGSDFNNGVWKYPDEELHDEFFTGSIWALAIPPDFIALAEEIDLWITKNASGSSANSPYITESFGGYSYTKATNADGQIVTWKDVFSQRLNRYRRLRVL